MADEATTPEAPAPVPAPKKSKPRAAKKSGKRLAGAALENKNAEAASAHKKVQEKQRAALKKANKTATTKQIGINHPRHNKGPVPRPPRG